MLIAFTELLIWRSQFINNHNNNNLLFIWANSAIAVEGVDQGDILRSQVEVPDVEVLQNPGLGDGFGNGDVAPLNLILQHDLGRGLVVFLGKAHDFRVVQQLWVAWFSPWPVWRSQRAVGGDDDVL